MRFIYFGMPLAAPNTPVLQNIVKQLSTLLWVQPVLLIAGIVQIYFVSAASLGEKASAILIVGVAVIGVLVWFSWVFYNWLNALLERPTRLTFSQSASRLNVLLIIFLILVGIGALANTIGLIGSLVIHINVPKFVDTITADLQLIALIVMFVVAYAARVWFRTGYSTAPIRLRPVLIWSMWAYMVVVVLQFVDSTVTTFTDPDTTSNGFTVVLSAGTTFVMLWILWLTIRLVQGTFGVDGERPVDDQQLTA